ncbi:MAG TPA: hypothetical protein VH092_21415 [Urbifossiella sp.]|jgi:hypothetical protein|nr:hypothetical protein [Urbifossiella sp.]
MTAAVPMFLAGASDRLADLALNCLAVAGGFLAGHLLGRLVVWGLDRWVFAKKTPEMLRKLVQMACGIAVAILVALIVFGKGGGTGGGSGDGQGKGSGDASDTPGKADAKPPDDKRPPVKVELPKAIDVDSSVPAVHVTVLAGPAAEGDKLYWFETDRTNLTLDAVKDKILKKKAEVAGKPLQLVVVFPTDPNHQPPDNHPTVTELTRWAEAQGIRWAPRRGESR